MSEKEKEKTNTFGLVIEANQNGWRRVTIHDQSVWDRMIVLADNINDMLDGKMAHELIHERRVIFSQAHGHSVDWCVAKTTTGLVSFFCNPGNGGGLGGLAQRADETEPVLVSGAWSGSAGLYNSIWGEENHVIKITLLGMYTDEQNSFGRFSTSGFHMNVHVLREVLNRSGIEFDFHQLISKRGEPTYWITFKGEDTARLIYPQGYIDPNKTDEFGELL